MSPAVARRVLLDAEPVFPPQEFSWGKRPGLWPARWISGADLQTPHIAAYRLRFRSEQTETVRLHMTADERYRLFLNGNEIGEGSERGDLRNWFFETYDLDLPAGEHVLVAQVWAYGTMAPHAQWSKSPGLLVCPDQMEDQARFATGTAPWEVKEMTGVSFTDPMCAWGTGANVVLDFSQYPMEALAGKGDDWEPVVSGDWAFDRRTRLEHRHLRTLRPAIIPPMHRAPWSRFRVRHAQVLAPGTPTNDQVVKAENHDAALADRIHGLLAEQTPLEVPVGSRIWAIVDLEDYVVGTAQVGLGGAPGGLARIYWQECLFEPGEGNEKGNRDEIEGKLFRQIWNHQEGVGDAFISGSGSTSAEAPWYQSGRYIELVFEAYEEPFTVEGIAIREYRYPMERSVHLKVENETFAAMLPMLERSAQTGATETFNDCPFYEQMQYIGDTRIQALVNFVWCKDDRLVRKALEMFDQSRTIDGITQSRYPASELQIIAPFSLWYICMAQDHFLWQGDSGFTRQLLPGIRAIVDHFVGCLRDDHLVNHPVGWNFIDWVPGWYHGSPPSGHSGPIASLNLQFVLALQAVVNLENAIGEPELAARCQRILDQVADAALAAFWDESHQRFAEELDHSCPSEHANTLALLTGRLEDERSAQVERVLENPEGIASCSIYFSHYVFEAYAQLGRGDLMEKRLEFWYDLVGQGFKTTPEHHEPTRSDCHAWGAHPLYHLSASVLGVRPIAPGGSRVKVAPCAAVAGDLEAEVPFGNGTIQISRTADTVRVYAPPAITLELADGVEVLNQPLW